MKIDVHAHYVPEQFLAVDPAAPELGEGVRITDTNGDVLFTQRLPVVPGRDVQQGSFTGDLDKRFFDMDSRQVDVQMLSISPQIFAYNLEPDVSIRVCRLLNDAFASTVAAHPTRFYALAHLPMRVPEAAAMELERCVRDLGFKGAMICTNVNGANLDDRSLAPFYAKVAELDVPVFLHPQNILAADRLSKYHLINLIGNPTDTAVAAASLIFGGVLKEYPRLKFYLAHAGGTCPYIRGRWDHGWRVRPEARANIDRLPSEYFKLLYFDSLAHSVPSLRFLIDQVGAERVMMGTDYDADMSDIDPVKTIASVPGLTDRERDLIYGENARELFKL